MSVAHTPGPWTAVRPVGGNGFWYVDGPDGHRGNVCVTYLDPAGDNARLIAAAPDMLAALLGIADAASTVAALESCGERETLQGIVGVAMAAIKKARGEQ